MSSKILADMLYALGVLSMFLLLGTYIRAKVGFLQKTFMPASVIGGFLMLVLGPIMLNWLPFPGDWMKLYSLIPGILIVPVVAIRSARRWTASQRLKASASCASSVSNWASV